MTIDMQHTTWPGPQQAKQVVVMYCVSLEQHFSLARRVPVLLTCTKSDYEKARRIEDNKACKVEINCKVIIADTVLRSKSVHIGQRRTQSNIVCMCVYVCVSICQL